MKPLSKNLNPDCRYYTARKDYQRGFYISKDRRGQEQNYNLMSLSIGIVSTEDINAKSYAQIASIATEVKKAAKMQPGSAIVKNRRITNAGLD